MKKEINSLQISPEKEGKNREIKVLQKIQPQQVHQNNMKNLKEKYRKLKTKLVAKYERTTVTRIDYEWQDFQKVDLFNKTCKYTDVLKIKAN